MTNPLHDWDRRIGERVRLRDLRILLTTVACGSMARAASQLSMTQPAISQAIAQLEAATQVPLLDRSSRGVTPTIYGEALISRANEAIDSLKQGMADIAFLSDPGAGEVVIGASESHIAGGFLAEIIQTLTVKYPRMAIRVVEANTAALAFTELRARKMDMMLGRISNQTLDDDLENHHLFDESLFVVAGGQNDWAHRDDIDFTDLVDKPWILSPPENAIHTLIGMAFRNRRLPMPSLSIATWSMTLRLQLLSDGPYVTAFPASLVEHNAKRWNLKALPIKLDERLPVVIVTLKHRTQSAATRVFIEQARASARALQQKAELKNVARFKRNIPRP